MRTIAFTVALLLSGTAFAGPARVIDGDTLAFGLVRVRLANVDAPEIRQTCVDANGDAYACGKEAKEALAQLVGDAPVTCRTTGQDRYGRQVAVCGTPNAPDLGAEMVRRGWAVDFRKYDRACAYCALEESAKSAHVGMWGGAFDLPWDWRANHLKALPKGR